MKRVKFFPTADITCGYNLKNAERVISAFDCLKADYTINEVVEFYNTLKYFEKGIYLQDWSQDYIEKCKEYSRSFQLLIRKYFIKIGNENIISEYLSLDVHYREDFWDLFNKYEVYDRITNETMEEILKLNQVSISEILRHRNIVNKYGKALRNKLIECNGSARIILNKYEMFSDRRSSEIFFPVELTVEDKELMILKYIDSPEAHINILEIIKNIKNNKEFKISDKTRLKAKRRMEEEMERLFKGNAGVRKGIEITFIEKQDEYRIIEKHGNDWHYSYSSEWVSENLDYSTLLNNFIYLFDYVDTQMRVTFVNKMSEMGVFERHVFMRSKNDYPRGGVFYHKNGLILLQMRAYYHILKKNNIKLEDIIEWFFKDYLKTEFGITNFKIKMPQDGFSFLEKCRLIFPVLESTLKQYSLFIEEGTIDNDLLQISSSSMNYDTLPSILREKKYIYGKGEVFNSAKYYLTSDQCMLSYVERVGEKYDCFYDLICNEEIYNSDFGEYLVDDLKWLREHNIINIGDDGKITLQDVHIVAVLVDLSRNDAGCYWHYPQKYKDAIKYLADEKMIEFDCKLLSRPEQDYISFLLNKNKFGNGFDIRNRYLHGTQVDNESDDAIHEQYYMYALIVFIICIIKINDELCIRYPLD